MKMIDLIEHKIIEVTGHYEIPIHLTLRKEMELNLSDFDVMFNEQLEEAFASIKLDEIDMPTYFIIYTDLGVDDRELMGDFILTRFVPYIIAKEIPEGREKRMSVPKELEILPIQYVTLLDLINKREHINQLNIGFATRSGKNIIKIAE